MEDQEQWREYDFNLDPVSFITIGTQGRPGERTFYLQATQRGNTVSLVIEKEHAIALAASIGRLLASVGADADLDAHDPSGSRMSLLEPLEAAFRVSELGLGVDEENEHVILVAHEGTTDSPGRSARFTASFDQMQALSSHALHVVKQGRPLCPLCGNPIGPESHFCPRANGHIKPEQ
jgi:uncharacterized repeat protein (TIGR03847 family)